jgi:integrase/recombinase XerD
MIHSLFPDARGLGIDVAVVISHDCDLAQLPDAEPMVEVILGKRIDRLDGNYSYAKNTRRLHLSFTRGKAPLYCTLHYLKNAKGNGDAVVDGAMQAIHRFEVYTRFRDFDKFDTRQAIAFKDHLAKQTNARTKEHLSQATLRSILAALKAFFRWLASQPGYRRLTYSDADYFNLSLHDEAIATARREKSPPTIEQIRHVVNTMPSRTDIERRDRAVVAFIILTGLRDNAVASLRLGDVDLVKGNVRQDARHLRTKFAQTNEVWFFPIGDDFRTIVEDWVTFLLVERHWGLDDPLFRQLKSPTALTRVFETKGLKRKGWANAEPIRAIFRAAFAVAGLPTAIHTYSERRWSSGSKKPAEPLRNLSADRPGQGRRPENRRSHSATRSGERGDLDEFPSWTFVQLLPPCFPENECHDPYLMSG